MLIVIYIVSLFHLVESWNPFASTNKRITLQSVMSHTWDSLSTSCLATSTGTALDREFSLRKQGKGSAHTDNDIRLFDSEAEPRVIFYKDRASWCPYCQKVWILLEEKKIPYKVEKINMRSYGDKPSEFLKMCPNGLLPAIRLDGGGVQTDSLPIMMTLERTFTGPKHKSMWPTSSTESDRAQSLMKLERALFGDWCNLVFRGSAGNSALRRFELTMDTVNRELQSTSSPWFLQELSIVDLTYITHIERMCASVAFWSGQQLRGQKWPAIERWLQAFEAMPSYMATKSDYYTHVMDIPPQYGPGCTMEGAEGIQRHILGGDGSWSLPLPPLTANDVEPIISYAGEEAARIEAAYKLIINHANIVKFACRGPGKPGRPQFQAPLADPYAIPNMDYQDPVDACLRWATSSLISGNYEGEAVPVVEGGDKARQGVADALVYLRDRIGVPRDMSYPAARQLRAHLNWILSEI